MAETLAQRVVNTFGLTKDQRTSALERGKNIIVTADAIRLTAGEPALLDSADLRPERWSQPQSAASYSGGETIVATSESSVDSLALTSSSRSSSPDIAWLPQSVQRWWPDVARIAARHKVDPELVAIIILVESGGDPEARSSAGATGLMQLMPATATEVAQQLGMSAFNLSRLTCLLYTSRCV